MLIACQSDRAQALRVHPLHGLQRPRSSTVQRGPRIARFHAVSLATISLQGLDGRQRLKAALLSSWFFVVVATLWLLKPVRAASLLANLGAAETPYVRLAGVVTIVIVVMLYTAVVDRMSRVAVIRVVNLLFGLVLLAFWAGIQIWGAWLGAQRPFVWAVYILVDIYAVILIGVFWTYTNDVVTPTEANQMYGVIGLGGIIGGAAGGAFVDAFARPLGPVHLLLVCAGLVVVSAVLGSVCEAVLRPTRRVVAAEKIGMMATLSGVKEVRNSRYLLFLVGIVIAYEFTATLTDFGVSVVFERSYSSQVELTKMYGRLGWIVSVTAIVAQLVLVPLLLPRKRIALTLPPAVMLASGVVVVAAPMVVTAIVLAAADRGLNYSLHQATKETLYVPLTNGQKYKAKAFIDMVVDRAAKAGAAFVLIAIIQTVGVSARAALIASFASMLAWLLLARRLGTLADARAAAAAKPADPIVAPPTLPVPIAEPIGIAPQATLGLPPEVSQTH
jgi:AAA family ATP:ADP antiporter